MPGDAEALQLRAFQEALLPKSCPSCGHAAIAAAFRAAEGVLGGDFHDAVPLGGADAYVIGDVTGHGLSASLVMAVLFGSIHEGLRHSWHPCEILEHQHGLLATLGARAGGPRLFSATVFVGVLTAAGALTYANAGHPPPLLLRTGQRPVTLDAVLPPLGLVEPTACHETTVQLAPGDRVLLYTDGLFGDHADPEALARRVAALDGLPPLALVDALVATGAADDRTAMLVTYDGPEG